MTACRYQAFSPPPLSLKEFRLLAGFIGEKTGILVSDAKRIMVESRLRKRLVALRLEAYGQYCDYLFSPGGMERELPHFIDAVTTNKTDFFREPEHFRFLSERAVPELLAARGSGPRRQLSIWSAAASTGNEAYTLAMTMGEFCRVHPGAAPEWSILASDISEEVLERGRTAIYSREEAAPIPEALKKRYLLKSRDPGRGLVRIVPGLRRRVRFQRINLVGHDLGLTKPMDIIFCRNVFIYFDQRLQERIVARLCRLLRPGGYLFTGHSELLNCRPVPLTSVAPSIYRRS